MGKLQGRTLLGLLCVSTCFNIALGRIVIVSRTRTPAPVVAAGTGMPALRAIDHATNRAVTVGYGDVRVPTVVYFFSPSCGFCKKNEKNIASIASQTAGKFRIIGISLSTDKLDDFIREAEITFPVYTNLDPTVGKAYRIGATPQTFVVGPDAKVKSMWTGAFTAVTQKSVEAFFSLRLPG